MLRPILLCGFAALAISATAAYADTTYTFTQQSWKSGSGSYGTVDINEASNDLSATVTVELSDGLNNIYFNQGGPASVGDSFEFNLAGAPGSFSFGVPSGFQEVNPAPDNSFGSFEYAVNCDYSGGACDKASQDSIYSLTFTITSTSTPIVFTPSDDVMFAAAVTDKPYSESDPTGNVAVTAAAPEPSSLMLLGTSVLGAAGVLRRRLKV